MLWYIVWLPGVFTKIAIFYYAVVLGTAQLLNLKDYKSVVLPVGVILAALSILSVNNSPEMIKYLSTGFPPFSFLFQWIIPLALLAVSIIRGNKAAS
ncbi:MAG: GerAB/ArcD/ProY family transporter [Bacillota bacterium]